jgi:hypothetical protein
VWQLLTGSVYQHATFKDEYRRLLDTHKEEASLATTEIERVLACLTPQH